MAICTYVVENHNKENNIIEDKEIKESQRSWLDATHSGYEMSNEEIVYVDGGWGWLRIVAVSVMAVGLAVALSGVGAIIFGGAKATVFGVSAKKLLILV